MRQSTPTILFLFVVASIPHTASAFGAFDYSAGAAARSLPLAASVFGVLGYNQLLWGEKKENEFKYGFGRLSVRLNTSGVVTRPELMGEFYPISLLGFQFGYSISHRATSIDTLDCAAVACRGLLSRSFLGSKLTLGYWKFYLLGFFRADLERPSLKDRPYADEFHALAGKQGGDTVINTEAIFGFRFDESIDAGIYFSEAHFLDSGNSNDLGSIFARKKWDNFRLALGMGMYRSSTQSRAWTTFGAVTWVGKPSLEL
ncbi:MAG: hypothetical protein AB7F43_07125 [Bacteriovoracia bacterium]